MSEKDVNLPLEQRAIRARCFHPSGEFVEFPKEDFAKSYAGLTTPYLIGLAAKMHLRKRHKKVTQCL